jgi:hypothetical protein
MSYKHFFAIFLIVLCAGCSATASSPTISVTNQETVISTITLPATATTNPLETIAISDLASGPHSAGYDLGKGPNTYCSKCHSPLNWDINATIGTPPNCVSCKFANESEVRIGEGNPLIPESEWKGISCGVCHKVTDNEVNPTITWHNPETNYYESMATSQQLCEKCHLDTETLRYKIDLGTTVHVDYDCTDCHQPHSVAANCQDTGCHAEVKFTEANRNGNKHTTAHQSIKCTACHDASGLDVDKIEGDDTWTTFRTVEVLGRAQTKPYTSHNLTTDINCQKCHYPENPWNLPLNDAE